MRAVAVLVVATPCPPCCSQRRWRSCLVCRGPLGGVWCIRSGGRRLREPRPRDDAGDGQDRHPDGRPSRRCEVLAAPGRDSTEILRLAASVDQMSPHVLAEAIVTEALARNLSLSLPADVIEQPGRGVTATVDGRGLRWANSPAKRPTRGGHGRLSTGRASIPPRSPGSAPTMRSSARCCYGIRCAAPLPEPYDGYAQPVSTDWSCSPGTARARAGSGHRARIGRGVCRPEPG